MSSILTTSSVLYCPHGGRIIVVPQSVRSRAPGDVALRFSDTFTIVGCSFSTPTTGPRPCVKVRWLFSTLRVGSNLIGVLTDESVGLCLSADNTPQGQVVVSPAGSPASVL
jgi:hypothetical protein